MCGKSQAYAVITVLTMYLKKKYPAKFFAALLSMQDKEEKIALYIKTARKAGIPIKTPDISKSSFDFIENNGEILYGLKSLKGVGGTSIPDLIKNQPYVSVQDMIDRVPKKSFNKTVGTALIKSGAMDNFNENRYELLNQFMDLRKDKCDRLNPIMYDKQACIDYEKEILGSSVTHIPWFETLDNDDTFSKDFEVVSCIEKISKKNTKYGVVTLMFEGDIIEAFVFGKVYNANKSLLKSEQRKKAQVEGKKDGNKIVVSSMYVNLIEEEKPVFDYV